MKRDAALKAIELTGIQNDSEAMVRLYTENRIGYMEALKAWGQGCRMRLAKEYA